MTTAKWIQSSRLAMLFGFLTILILEFDAHSVGSRVADLAHCHDTADCTAWASGSSCLNQICYCPWGQVPNLTSRNCEAYGSCKDDQACTQLNLPFAGDLMCSGPPNGTCVCLSPGFTLDSTSGRKCVPASVDEQTDIQLSTKAETFMGMPVKVAFIVLLIFVILLAIGVSAFGFSVWILYQDDDTPGEVALAEAQAKASAAAAARAGSNDDHGGGSNSGAAQAHLEPKPKSKTSNPKLNKGASKIAQSKMESSKMGSKSKLDSESQAGLSAVGVSKSFQVSSK